MGPQRYKVVVESNTHEGSRFKSQIVASRPVKFLDVRKRVLLHVPKPLQSRDTPILSQQNGALRTTAQPGDPFTRISRCRWRLSFRGESLSNAASVPFSNIPRLIMPARVVDCAACCRKQMNSRLLSFLNSALHAELLPQKGVAEVEYVVASEHQKKACNRVSH